MGIHDIDELLQIYGLKFDMRVLENLMNQRGVSWENAYGQVRSVRPVSSYEVDGVHYEVYDKGVM